MEDESHLIPDYKLFNTVPTTSMFKILRLSCPPFRPPSRHRRGVVVFVVVVGPWKAFTSITCFIQDVKYGRELARESSAQRANSLYIVYQKHVLFSDAIKMIISPSDILYRMKIPSTYRL